MKHLKYLTQIAYVHIRAPVFFCWSRKSSFFLSFSPDILSAFSQSDGFSALCMLTKTIPTLFWSTGRVIDIYVQYRLQSRALLFPSFECRIGHIIVKFSSFQWQYVLLPCLWFLKVKEWILRAWKIYSRHEEVSCSFQVFFRSFSSYTERVVDLLGLRIPSRIQTYMQCGHNFLFFFFSEFRRRCRIAQIFLGFWFLVTRLGLVLMNVVQQFQHPGCTRVFRKSPKRSRPGCRLCLLRCPACLCDVSILSNHFRIFLKLVEFAK